MLQEIKHWLNTSKRDYFQGISILKKIDPDTALKLSTGHHRPDQLFNALRSHLGKPIPKQVINPEILIEPQNSLPNIKSTSIPLNTLSVRLEVKNDIANSQLRVAQKLYKEMSNKRALLFKLCPQKQTRFENEARAIAERSELTKIVMELRYQVDEAYTAYDFALEHNRLPETFSVDSVPAEDLYRQITNCQKYISKLQKLKDPTPAQGKRLEEKKLELLNLQKAYTR